jgi:uncharacterized protein YkwD
MALANTVLTTINGDRAAHHLAPLALDLHQSACSLSHSVHMAAEGAISHDEFPSDICIEHQTAGENVGVSGGDAQTAIRGIDHSMMSEGPCPHATCSAQEFERHGHYLNLMSRTFTRVGIGVYLSGGLTWITEDFTS